MPRAHTTYLSWRLLSRAPMPPLAKADLTNTYWSVIPLLSLSPFGLYTSRTYAARGILVEALEQARLDGVSERRIFWSIASPHDDSRPR